MNQPNLFDEIDHTTWGGNGTFLQVGNEAADITVAHNSVVHSGNVVTAYGGTAASPRAIRGFRFVDNIVPHNRYGIFGTNWGTGTSAIARYFADGAITANVLAGGNGSLYPAGNFFPTMAQLLSELENPGAHDYRPLPSSPLRRAATDGTTVGVDFDELTRALGAVDLGPGSASAPPAPTGFRAQTAGLAVMLSWNASAGAASYILEAGSAPGLANLFNANVGAGTSLGTMVQGGIYFARVRAVNAGGVSASSAEVRLMVGAGLGPCGVPAPPMAHAVQTSGSNVRLSWQPSAGATSYVLEAGSASGLANLVDVNVGAVTSLGTTASPSRYFTRVRAVSACGISAPSNEVTFALACATLAAPTGLAFAKSGRLLTLVWNGSPGAATYQLQAGTAPGLSNALNVDIGSATRQQFDLAGVPPGTYFVRVLVKTACGASGPSADVAIPVP